MRSLALCALAGWGCAGGQDSTSESVGSLQQALTIGAPHRVKALDYVAFHDSDTTHEGNCGSGPVDAETTSDPNGGGCDVGWTHPGEWLEYSIQIPSTGKYDLTARVASAMSGKTIRLSIDGQDLAGSIAVPNAGWQAFADKNVRDVSLNAGSHTVRVSFETGDTNFNYLDVAPGTLALPARIEAEGYQRANESTPNANTGAACDRGDGVDEQTTSDANGVCNVGWTTPGEWLEYDVSVAQGGLFDIVARAGSGVDGHTLRLSLDGADVGTLTVPNVGWSAFQDRTLSNVNLTTGAHTLRATFPEGDVNLNYLNLISKAPPPAAVPHRITALAYGSFQDSDNVHEGNCGAGPVDAETTTDPTGGGCDVAYTRPGEWLQYAVQVPTAAKYHLTARVASALSGKTFRLSVDGQDLLGAISVPSTGWQSFADRALKDVPLTAGTHALRVSFETGDTNFNYLDIAPGTVDLPARIEAESYQRASESTPAANTGGGCDRGDGVDKENTADVAGGGCNIGWTTVGEWLEYDIKATQAGAFDVLARVGSGVTGHTVRLALDGTTIGTLSVSNTGWTSFEDKTLANVNVSAGSHVLRVTFVEGDVNLNYLGITPTPSSSSSGGAVPSSFGAAAAYNAFLFHDLQNTPTIAGPVAAGRDIVAQAFGYNTSSAGLIGAVAGRNFSASNGSVHRDLIYGATQALSNVGVTNGTVRQATPIDFAVERTNLQSLSTALNALSGGGQTAVSADGTTVEFTGTDVNLNVFSILGSSLASADVIKFTVPASSTAVVNVSGSSATFETAGMQLNGLTPGHLIWNFPVATSLRLSLMGFEGTLLAVNAAVSQNSSTLEGALLADSLVGGDNGLTWAPFNGQWPFTGCSSDAECTGGRVCWQNSGRRFDRAGAVGVCVVPECKTGMGSAEPPRTHVATARCSRKRVLPIRSASRVRCAAPTTAAPLVCPQPPKCVG